jgi:hypothetical protein
MLLLRLVLQQVQPVSRLYRRARIYLLGGTSLVGGDYECQPSMCFAKRQFDDPWG